MKPKLIEIQGTVALRIKVPIQTEEGLLLGIFPIEVIQRLKPTKEEIEALGFRETMQMYLKELTTEEIDHIVELTRDDTHHKKFTHQIVVHYYHCHLCGTRESKVHKILCYDVTRHENMISNLYTCNHCEEVLMRDWSKETIIKSLLAERRRI